MAHDRHPEDALVVTAAELNFLLGDGLGLPVVVDAHVDRLTLWVNIDRSSGCYPVHYAGAVSVISGHANLRPDVFDVGALHLGGLTSWRTWEVGLGLLSETAAADALAHLRTARVVNGRIELWLSEPVALWERVAATP